LFPLWLVLIADDPSLAADFILATDAHDASNRHDEADDHEEDAKENFDVHQCVSLPALARRIPVSDAPGGSQ
jgi:hypothetical protein